MHSDTKPTTYQRNLAKLPPPLAPLIERPQWCVWRWTQKPDGSWQKPPFMATQPERHASTNNPNTWADYPAALATMQAGHADGLSYVLTANDPFGAIDLDHCRDKLCSIDVWAQNFMQAAVNSYQEVTPSGEGVRIWGFADGDPLNRKFALEIDGKKIAAELFRRTNKALTITGYRLNTVQQLTNIDSVFDWAVVWGERRKAQEQKQTPLNGNGFDSAGCKYTIDQIEQIVREGPPAGANRSDVFHAIVGHYVGCGWQVDRILEHLQQYPDGIGSRYLAEDRLLREIERSAGKYVKAELPLFDDWTVRSPQPEIPAQEKEPPPFDTDPELDEPGIEDDELEDEETSTDDDQEPQGDPDLPKLCRPGNAKPVRKWLIKDLLKEVGHGLLSGQWGTGKTFEFFDIAACVMTGQPFLGHRIKRQCGVLLIAAEGQDEVEIRLSAVVREKCGEMQQIPFLWYEQTPALLHRGSIKALVAMARQAEAEFEEKFGLPLGLIGIDTIVAAAGYAKSGDESDNAVGQAIMSVLQAVAQELGCFVLGIDHFGKDQTAGTRGAGSKESSADLVLACLGDRQVDGNVTNTRLAVRKQRGGRQGQVHPFALRQVELGTDEDGDPISTMVVDWLPPGSAQAAPAPDDPWARPKRQDQRTAALRLKRVLITILAEQGVDLPIPPDGPVARMVDQKIVRKAFYACTVADGTSKQQRQARHTQFKSALNWAEQNRLIGVGEISDVTYLWLAQLDFDEDSEG
jgi:AAA domain